MNNPLISLASTVWATALVNLVGVFVPPVSVFVCLFLFGLGMAVMKLGREVQQAVDKDGG